MSSHRGSSLVFLGFSIIAFVLSYGLMFYLVPTVLGMFYSTVNNMTISDPAWAATRTQTNSVLQWLIPLIPTIGIMILVVKVLMVSTTRGRD